jgi:hypothetical protein
VDSVDANSGRVFAHFDIVDSSDTNSGRVFACFDIVDSSQSNSGRIFVGLCSLSNSGHFSP